MDSVFMRIFRLFLVECTIEWSSNILHHILYLCYTNLTFIDVILLNLFPQKVHLVVHLGVEVSVALDLTVAGDEPAVQLVVTVLQYQQLNNYLWLVTLNLFSQQVYYWSCY